MLTPEETDVLMALIAKGIAPPEADEAEPVDVPPGAPSVPDPAPVVDPVAPPAAAPPDAAPAAPAAAPGPSDLVGSDPSGTVPENTPDPAAPVVGLYGGS